MTQLIEFWHQMNQESIVAYYLLRGLSTVAMIVGFIGVFSVWRRGDLAEATRIFREWLRAVEKSAERRRAQRAPRGLLIDLCLPPDRADDVIYNLLSRYDHWVEKHGPRWARVIFFSQSAGSIVTFWTDWLMKRLKLLKTFVSS
jgi:hypothetical protein